MEQGTLLIANDLHHTYFGGINALKGINLSINTGELTVILGKNGSGKTTLVNCLSGLIQPTKGTIILNKNSQNGLNNSSPKTLRKLSGVIFQGANLIDDLTVMTNVLIGRLSYMPLWRAISFRFKDEDKDIAYEVLKRMDMQDKIYELAGSLSGGQKQKVAIARALVKRPLLLFADEPIANLDPKSSEEIMEHLAYISQEKESTVVCILHRIDRAERYADRIIGIKNGEKVVDKMVSQFNNNDLLEIYKTESVLINNKDICPEFLGENKTLTHGRNYCYRKN